jgi:glycosyltransferase involved in cell wall biosynthesis
MKKDFISLCIITKDEEKYLLKTLNYLINQSYGKENFEIIIVDGNSKDNTIETTKTFLSQNTIDHKVVNEKDHPNKRG